MPKEVCQARMAALDERNHRLKLESTGPAGITSLTAASVRNLARKDVVVSVFASWQRFLDILNAVADFSSCVNCELLLFLLK